MRIATRLNHLETQIGNRRTQTACYVGTDLPICTGDREQDAFLRNVGCTRPYLDHAWWEAIIVDVVRELVGGEWVHVHNTLYPTLEHRVTWPELNVVLLQQLEGGGYIEKRVSPLDDWWHEVRLTPQGHANARVLLEEERA